MQGKNQESTVADWDSMCHVIKQTRGRAFEILDRAFERFVRMC